VISRIHSKLGTAGFIISILALVVALGGGAYAASGGLTGKQKKEVEKIAKSVSKPGKAGPAGAIGATGPAGAPGAAGKDGANGVGTEGKEGKQGIQGTPGKDGESVEAIPVAAGGTGCSGNGGAVLEPEGIEICNGKEGKDGKEGSPWTAGGTLPKGSTETGAWAFSASEADGENAENGLFIPLSFPIKLTEAAAAATQVVVVRTPLEGGCEGNAVNPTAPEGKMCLYISPGSLNNATIGGIFNLSGTTEEANGAGALLFVENVTDGAYGFGSFAVTAN
jgi:hypothetical protein